MLTFMTVSEKYIFSYISEPVLVALLILFAFDIKVLDFLNIEVGHFNNNFANR